VKPIEFLGDSRQALRDFPETVRTRAGAELRTIQLGLEPADWKPMRSIAPGVREIRIRDRSGAFRVIYLATLPDRVLVLHSFQKKEQRTSKHDIDLAAARLKEWRARR
jgi:phage-related protein